MQTVGDFRLIIPKHDNTVNTRLFPGQQPAYYGLLLDAGNHKPRFHAFQTKTLRYARVRARKKKRGKRNDAKVYNFKIKFLDPIAHSYSHARACSIISISGYEKYEGAGDDRT